VLDRIVGEEQPVTARPGELLAPGIERVRRERGPFASDDDLLLAAFYNPEQYASLVAARPIRTDYPVGRTPLVTLIKELAARRDIAAVSLVRKR
jgi:oxaloacetate decarboxylase alpha subunit